MTQRSIGVAVRNLRRAPAFTGLVVLTLALGIGATTAMFSVVDAVLIRRPPYPGIERFAEIRAAQPGPFRMSGVSGTAMPMLRQGLAGVAAVEGYQMGSATITGGREPEIVASPSITPNLLAFIGATPHLGRLFNESDLSATAQAIIISHRLWTTSFGADPAIIGRVVELDDQPNTVIGVMSPRVRYPEANAAIWKPLSLDQASKSRQRVQVVSVRFPTVAGTEFASTLKSVEQSLKQAKLLTDVQTLESDILTQERFARADSRGLWLMFGAVSLVLLVACANVSSLQLARAERQYGDLAVRSALGASRSGLIAALLAESIVLAVAGGIGGLLVANVLLAVLLKILPVQLTFLATSVSEIDLRVLMFAFALSLVTAMASGLLPAIRSSKADPIDAIRRNSGATTGRNEWWQSTLLAGQLALVLVLLAGAGVLLRSFVTLSTIDPGFRVEGLSVIQPYLSISRYPGGGSGLLLMQDLERRLEAQGQMQVTIASGPPVFGVGVYGNIKPEAEGGVPRDFTGQILPRMEVAPDYFSTLGVVVQQGRAFAATDGDDVVVINDKMAAYFWGDASPVGRRFRMDTKEPWRIVVGVVADVRQMRINDPLSHGMEIYFPNSMRQAAGTYTVLVRSDRDSAEVIASVKHALWALDARIPVSEATSMADRIGESLYRERFFVRLSSVFTAIATLLAMVGVYGTTSYWVGRRTRELAIRMAIGASPQDVIRSVVVRSLRVALAGATAGLALAIAGATVLQSQLYQTDPRDPVMLTAVSVAMVLAALAACAPPALRAARVDPMTTLRAE